MNLSYYISDGVSQKGKFTKEELSNQEITRNTLVWREGFDKWLPIENVSELCSLLEKLPPPLPNTAPPILQSKLSEIEDEEEMERPDNLIWAIVLHSITILLGLVSTASSLQSFQSYYRQSYGDSANLVYNWNLWGTTIIYIVYLVLLYNRQNWARKTYLVIYIIGLLFLPLALSFASKANVPGIGITLVNIVINLIAIILLFTPSNNRWFSQR